MGKRANGEGTAYRYRNGWAAQVTVKDQLGRPKRKTVYGKTQAEVLEKKRTVLRAASAGVVTTGRKLKLAELLESWVTQTLPARVQLGQLSATTVDSYQDLVRRHIVPSLGHLPAEQLTAPQIRGWLTEKSKETSARGRPLSPRTVQYLHAVLRKALADAVRDGLLERNVALLVEPPRGKAARVRSLTVEEARRLLAAAADDPHRLLWLTLLSLGLRRGEALALRWDDIDLDDQVLFVRRSLQRVRGAVDEQTGRRRGELVEKAPKTVASARRLALPAFLAEEFRRHRAAQRAQRMAALAWVDPGLVFTTGAGTALEPRNVNRAWQALGERAELGRHVRVHDLRHAAASFLLLQGADMRVVMDQLGHSRMATTSDLYTHVLDEVQRDAAGKMNTLLRHLT